MNDFFANIFQRQLWAGVPFHFWSVVFFILGSMVGSLLNVCIHRMPRGESIIRPPSHCPHCNYSIPWYLNMPLITWVALRGKCANCKTPISIRYFLVELLTGVAFLAAWLRFGELSVLLALVNCFILAGFIVAIFIDMEHLIIPDEITIGGIVAGFVLSAVAPLLHGTEDRAAALTSSFWGIVVGGGVIYLILRGGKLAFGKEKIELSEESKIIFTETALQLPDREIPFEEIFYRKSDYIKLYGKTVELPDRCYFKCVVTLTPEKLTIGEETLDPATVPHMEIVASELIMPREAMGFGDVKFMAAIGAFMGWKATVFSLMWSSVIGTLVVVLTLVLRRREWGSRIPYGPYIALAAIIWMFLPDRLRALWNDYMNTLVSIFSGSYQ